MHDVLSPGVSRALVAPGVVREGYYVKKPREDRRELEVVRYLLNLPETHPNIVWMEITAGPLIQMPQYPRDLFTAITTDDTLNIQTILVGMASGLAWLHDNGVVHRDIKPENVLLDSWDSPRLADFDLACLCPRDHTIHVETGGVGSIQYAAPEMFDLPSEHGAPADVWSCAVVLAVMCTRCWAVDVEVRGARAWSVYMTDLWPRLPEARAELWVGEYPVDLMARCEHLLYSMLTLDPHHRPTAQGVAEYARKGDAEATS
jgi:serine/threonine protein kinase